MSFCIIPARGGSKRIPRKNIKKFDGVPMLERAIATAFSSESISTVFVSTEDSEIMDVARKMRAVVIARPEILADDYTTTAEVLEHALKVVPQVSEFVCCMYPCVPFLEADDVDQGYKLISENETTSAFAVTEYPAQIERALKIVDGHLEMIHPEHRDTRTQDLEPSFYDVGQFYWVQVERFLDDPVLWGNDSLPVYIPPWRAHDIDTPDDWMRAEKIYESYDRSVDRPVWAKLH